MMRLEGARRLLKGVGPPWQAKGPIMRINDTIRRFGYPDTLVADYEHWVVLVRPAQPTLGSLILAARGDATAFGDLADGAHAELRTITRHIEAALHQLVAYERINYLMLMMVDRHVHFHVIPRYAGDRRLDNLVIADLGWPGPPDLKAGAVPGPTQLVDIKRRLIEKFAAL